MFMFRICSVLLLVHAASAASPERWCECSSAIDGSCYGTCHDEDNVGITNAVTNSSIDEGQEEYTDMMAQLREMSGIKYSTTNMKNKPHCNGPIYRFNYTCLQLADISSICSSETVSLTLNGAIWTKSYPVASDADRKSRYCTCNLHINAKGFKVIKYDYNLTNDQSLRLTFSNGSTYQDWNSPFNINDVANGNSSLKNANTDITVHWANPKLEQELFYIGFEVTNGTVNVTCEEGVIVAPSTISLPTNKINPAAPTAATNANTSTVSIGNITSIAPTPAVQTAASNTKKVTVSNGNIFSITSTLSISSKIASSSISSSLSNSSIEKTAVGESTRETSEQPNEKNSKYQIL
ncbi:uncharacterized protein LOC128204777 [Mya arenaria]|uniref:uncharacterized protein LOC128204777 n=1 Tax=Mya arenaria TaxID=6604 RepID=UPI0022E9782F|nr:uncharacterized protein LOC128204777 [Mya arenaria]